MNIIVKQNKKPCQPLKDKHFYNCLNQPELSPISESLLCFIKTRRKKFLKCDIISGCMAIISFTGHNLHAWISHSKTFIDFMASTTIYKLSSIQYIGRVSNSPGKEISFATSRPVTCG